MQCWAIGFEFSRLLTRLELDRGELQWVAVCVAACVAVCVAVCAAVS